MVNVFLFFIFSTKRTNIEISTSHLFIFTLKLKKQLHEITTVTQNLFTILLISYIIMNISHNIH